jgi:hypothetical protein
MNAVQHGATYRDLAYVRRRYITVENLRDHRQRHSTWKAGSPSERFITCAAMGSQMAPHNTTLRRTSFSAALGPRTRSGASAGRRYRQRSRLRRLRTSRSRKRKVQVLDSVVAVVADHQRAAIPGGLDEIVDLHRQGGLFRRLAIRLRNRHVGLKLDSELRATRRGELLTIDRPFINVRTRSLLSRRCPLTRQNQTAHTTCLLSCTCFRDALNKST